MRVIGAIIAVVCFGASLSEGAGVSAQEGCPEPEVLLLRCEATRLKLKESTWVLRQDGWQCRIKRGSPNTEGPWVFVDNDCVHQHRSRLIDRHLTPCTEEEE